MRKLTLAVLCILAILCGVSSAQSQSANVASLKSSAGPNQVRFQGLVRDQNGKVLSGVAGITFALYQDEQGGGALWMETQNVQVAGQKEQNRVLLLSVPYALKAADAETVGGLPPSAFALAVPPSGGNWGAASALTSSSNFAPEKI